MIVTAVGNPISQAAAEQMASVLRSEIPDEVHSHWCQRYRREAHVTTCLPHCAAIRAALEAAGRMPS